MPPLKNAIICSALFELSCFEEDFREKLMPGSYGRSRSLRANAIRTISHTKSANERPASERRKRKACHEEVSAALILIRKNPILSRAK